MTALSDLLTGFIDYAGLFPPASQSMDVAAAAYVEYADGRDARWLGRLVVPASRLNELNETLASMQNVPRVRVSAIIGADADADAAAVARFNGENGHASVDAVERVVRGPADVESFRLPHGVVDEFIEVAPGADHRDVFAAVQRAGARLKFRTGGVTADAFPDASALVASIASAVRASIAFKATAGLHHPLRGEYRLTYKADAACGSMYGYLNVFLATALLVLGGDAEDARAVLVEADRNAIAINADCIRWRQRVFSPSDIRRIRQQGLMSIGSCSFREPVDEIGAAA